MYCLSFKKIFFQILRILFFFNIAQILFYFKITSPERQEKRDGVPSLVLLVETNMWHKILVELSESCLPLTTAW